MKRFIYVGSCVGLPEAFIDFIRRAARPERISYRAFARLADLSEFRGWRLSVDWHVSFWKSRTPSGIPCIYFGHSGIEHVFVPSDDAQRFDADHEAEMAEALDA